MNKIYLVTAAAMLMIAAGSCTNSTNPASKSAALNLNTYVDSVSNLTPLYTQENWTQIDNGYQERAMLAEKNIDKLEADEKTRNEASKAKYAELKANYAVKIKEHDAALLDAAVTVPAKADYRQVLRNRLFGEGRIGTDMKFGFVTGNNIKDVYQNFVDKVADNKSDYSREDWDEIKVLYEALDTRKNEVEKDLSGKDNMKIAGLKIRFASILATHRPGSKVKENEDAKQ